MSPIRELKIPNINPIRELVYTQLRKAILAGEIPVGEKLVEAQLASQLGVSRTPVREALHKLESEYLVSSIPRVGYFAKVLNEEDLRDICEIRSVIEGLAARKAIGLISEKNLSKLKRNIKLSKQAVAQGSLEKMVNLDTEFHDILCQSSGSKRIYQLCQKFREYMLKFRVECFRHSQIASRAVIGHEKIYRAICNRDSSEVGIRVDSHLRDVMEDVIAYYRSGIKSNHEP